MISFPRGSTRSVVSAALTRQLEKADTVHLSECRSKTDLITGQTKWGSWSGCRTPLQGSFKSGFTLSC